MLSRCNLRFSNIDGSLVVVVVIIVAGVLASFVVASILSSVGLLLLCLVTSRVVVIEVVEFTMGSRTVLISMIHLSVASIVLGLLLAAESLIVLIVEIREIIKLSLSLIWEILWQPHRWHERRLHLSFHSSSGHIGRILHLSIIQRLLHLHEFQGRERIESEWHILTEWISILISCLSSVSDSLLLQLILSDLLGLQEVHVLVVATEEGTELVAVFQALLELSHERIRFDLIAKMHCRILEFTLSILSTSLVSGLLDELQRENFCFGKFLEFGLNEGLIDTLLNISEINVALVAVLLFGNDILEGSLVFLELSVRNARIDS